MNNTKKQKHIGKANGTTAQIVHVTFSHPQAGNVAVAGTFNQWRPEASPMIPVGEGQWLKELVLPPGTYEYLLVVDGEWLPDPQAGESVSNPFGGRNSVLKVPEPQNGNGKKHRVYARVE